MYEFYLGEKKRQMKNSWYELTRDEFIIICGVLNRYMNGNISLFDARVLLTMLLIGMDIRRIRTGGHMDENIYKLSRELDFFFRIEYDDPKAFKAFSPEIQKQLVRKFPEDLDQVPEIRAAARLKKHVKLDVEFGKNMIQDIYINRQRIFGYTFIVIDGIAQTSLTALQFSEAQKVISQYNENKSTRLLDLLCGILYQCGYTEEIALELSTQFHRVGQDIKESVLMNFLAITNYIVHQTRYRILFDRPKKSGKSGKYSLGLTDNMYMLSKKGYGNARQIEDIGLFKFFDMLVKELADQARELKARDKKLPEIANEMNLTIEQLNDLL